MSRLRELLLMMPEQPPVRRIVNRLYLEFVHVERVQTGQAGLLRAGQQTWHLLVAAAALPDMKAEELLIRLRNDRLAYPVVILTDKRESSRVARLLQLGASDVISVTEPVEEVVARIWSLLRLHRIDHEEAGPPIAVDHLRIDPSSRMVHVEGEPVMLTATEFDLLYYLAKNEGKALPREQILSHVWGYEFAGDSNLVDVYIRYLRLKIDKKYKKKLIHTVRGYGYRFQADV